MMIDDCTADFPQKFRRSKGFSLFNNFGYYADDDVDK